jgi:fumarate hydratase class II
MNPSLITLLSPKIGYLKAAEIAEEAMETKESIKNIVLKRGILSADEADKLFDLKIISQNRFNDK